MSLLNSNIVMIYIIHKLLVLLKNCLNYFKNSIFQYIRLFFFKLFIFTTYNNEKPES